MGCQCSSGAWSRQRGGSSHGRKTRLTCLAILTAHAVEGGSSKVGTAVEVGQAALPLLDDTSRLDRLERLLEAVGLRNKECYQRKGHAQAGERQWPVDRHGDSQRREKMLRVG